MIDTHTHLDQPEFDSDRHRVISNCLEMGIQAMICVGTSATSSAAAVQLATEQAQVYAAVGIQPNHVAEAKKGDWTRVVELATNPQVVAVGETGLDRHWDFTPLDAQQDYFDRHLRLAQEFSLPIVVHCREAEADLLPMLRDAARRSPLRGVLHSFSGTPEFAAECLELGLLLSFSGAVTYLNAKFRPLREIAKTVPEDRLLIETDSPYLVPHPIRGRQKRNEPANLRLVAGSLAELREVSLDHLAAVTSVNAHRLFRLVRC